MAIEEKSIYDQFLPFVMSVFSAVVTFIMAWFWFNKSRSDESNKAFIERLSLLEKKAAINEQAIMPISAAFQAILVKQLTHYHTPVLDALLAKLDPFALTDDEEETLYDELKARTRDMGSQIDEQERNAARMLPYVISRVRHEKDDNNTAALQIVGVPSMGEEEPKNNSAENTDSKNEV